MQNEFESSLRSFLDVAKIGDKATLERATRSFKNMGRLSHEEFRVMMDALDNHPRFTWIFFFFCIPAIIGFLLKEDEFKGHNLDKRLVAHHLMVGYMQTSRRPHLLKCESAYHLRFFLGKFCKQVLWEQIKEDEGIKETNKNIYHKGIPDSAWDYVLGLIRNKKIRKLLYLTHVRELSTVSICKMLSITEKEHATLLKTGNEMLWNTLANHKTLFFSEKEKKKKKKDNKDDQEIVRTSDLIPLFIQLPHHINHLEDNPGLQHSLTNIASKDSKGDNSSTIHIEHHEDLDDIIDHFNYKQLLDEKNFDEEIDRRILEMKLSDKSSFEIARKLQIYCEYMEIRPTEEIKHFFDNQVDIINIEDLNTKIEECTACCHHDGVTADHFKTMLLKSFEKARGWIDVRAKRKLNDFTNYVIWRFQIRHNLEAAKTKALHYIRTEQNLDLDNVISIASSFMNFLGYPTSESSVLDLLKKQMIIKDGKINFADLKIEITGSKCSFDSVKELALFFNEDQETFNSGHALIVAIICMRLLRHLSCDMPRKTADIPRGGEACHI